MNIYKLKSEKLHGSKEVQFDLEKDIQQIVENNLAELFNLEFVQSEFRVDDKRIDTLGFDPESNSFCNH